MNKLFLAVVAIAVIGGSVYYYKAPSPSAEAEPTAVPQSSENTPQEAQAVTAGSYRLDPAQSTFNWSARKPLIEGYVNSGTIGLAEGDITVGENTAGGSFTLDMNTIHVGLTAKKPGKEGALEGHLKSKGFFNVEEFPTATFVITKVEPLDAEQNRYTVTGDLTMKGVTNSITFPASIYMDGETLIAEAETEIDRTKWGITVGSGSFFENLGDNMIDDMVALSFTIKAPKTE